MDIREFLQNIDDVNFVDIDSNHTYYSHERELFNRSTGKTFKFNSHQELLNFYLNNKKVEDIISSDDYKFFIDLA